MTATHTHTNGGRFTVASSESPAVWGFSGLSSPALAVAAYAEINRVPVESITVGCKVDA